MSKFEFKRTVHQRGTYTATFCHYDSKHGRSMICLTDIKERGGKLVTNYLRMSHTLGFRRLGTLEKGVVIKFDARMKTYMRSDGQLDYELFYPTYLVAYTCH